MPPLPCDATGLPATPGQRILISGYYGFGNLGDELILRVLIQELTKNLKIRHAQITVLSANPQQTAQAYGVQAISRTNLPGIIQALSQTDRLISGGGGLFQDATGWASPVYYGGLILLARLLGVPVTFWSQGVGPLRRRVCRLISGWAFKACDFISVRDAASAALVTELSGGKQPVRVDDPVWRLQLPPAEMSLAETPKDDTHYHLALSLRPWPGLTPQKLSEIAAMILEKAQQQAENKLEKKSGNNLKPIKLWLLAFQPEWDTPVLQAFVRDYLLHDSALVGLISQTQLLTDDTAMLAAYRNFDVVVGMRYHSLVLAVLAGVPAFALAYDAKVSQLMAQRNLPGLAV